MIIYADILFIIDASMDFLTLYICGKITNQKTSVIRILTGSCMGALTSVFLLYIPLNPFFSVSISVLCSSIMVLITFGRMNGMLSFIRQCILVWGCGALTGGILTVLLSVGTPVYVGVPDKQGYPAVFLCTIILCLVFSRFFTDKMTVKTAEIIIQRDTISERVSALVDSGNLLKDPLSGRPVILVSENAIHKIYTTINAENLEENIKVRLIPMHGVEGEKILYGVLPDKVSVNGKSKDVVIVVNNVPEDHYGGYGALCPVCVL